MALTRIEVGLLSDNAVTTASIVDGTIVLADIANGAVSSTKMSNTGVTAATYGSSTQIPVVAVDGAGRITVAANATPSIANTQITGVMTATQLANTGVTASTYGGSSAIPAITVDAQGRITNASNVSANFATTGKAIAMAMVFGG